MKSIFKIDLSQENEIYELKIMVLHINIKLHAFNFIYYNIVFDFMFK